MIRDLLIGKTNFDMLSINFRRWVLFFFFLGQLDGSFWARPTWKIVPWFWFVYHWQSCLNISSYEDILLFPVVNQLVFRRIDKSSRMKLRKLWTFWGDSQENSFRLLMETSGMVYWMEEERCPYILLSMVSNRISYFLIFCMNLLLKFEVWYYCFSTSYSKRC